MRGASGSSRYGRGLPYLREAHDIHSSRPREEEGYALATRAQIREDALADQGSQQGNMDPNPGRQWDRDLCPYNPSNLPALFRDLEAEFPPCPSYLNPGLFEYTGYHLHGHSTGGESSVGYLELRTPPSLFSGECWDTDEFDNTTGVPIYVLYFTPHGYQNFVVGEPEDIYELMHQLKDFNNSLTQGKRLTDHLNFTKLSRPGLQDWYPHQSIQVPYVFCPGPNRRVPNILFSPNEKDEEGYVCDEWLVRLPENPPKFSRKELVKIHDDPEKYPIDTIVGEENVLLSSDKFKERGDLKLVQILRMICRDFKKESEYKGIVLFVASCRGQNDGKNFMASCRGENEGEDVV